MFAQSIPIDVRVRVITDTTDPIWDILTAIGTVGATVVAGFAVWWSLRQSRKDSALNLTINAQMTEKGRRFTITNNGPRTVTLDRVTFFGRLSDDKRPTVNASDVQTYHGDTLPERLEEGEHIKLTFDLPMEAEVIRVYDTLGRSQSGSTNPFASGVRLTQKARRRLKLDR